MTSSTMSESDAEANGTEPGISFTSDQSLPEAWCSRNLTIPYLDPCYGLTMQVARATGAGIAVTGLVLNGVSLLSLSRMRMNAESLFLLKSLAVYDLVYLAAFLVILPPRYLAWVLGHGDIQYTAYLYVYQVVFFLYRIGLSMAFWVVFILSTQR